MEATGRKRLVRIAAYLAAIVAGLAVVLAGALFLEAREPEPGNATVLVVVGASAVVAAILGRATYRAVVGVFTQ